MLTKQNSTKTMNTNIVLIDINASTIFIYETGGSEACDLACCVDNVNSVVTPSVMRAGSAVGFIQKLIHCIEDERNQIERKRFWEIEFTEMMTIKHVGMYVLIMK